MVIPTPYAPGLRIRAIDARLTGMAEWSELGIVVILAGGSSRRMGTDKLVLVRDGVTLLDTVLDATRGQIARHGCRTHMIVVGPQPSAGLGEASDVHVTREDPPGSGPVAALSAGLDVLSPGRESVVIVLAGDAPNGPTAIPALLAALGDDDDAAILIDDTGRQQPLCGAYRIGPLRNALDDLADLGGRRMDDVLSRLSITVVPDTDGAALDIDTPADAERFGFTRD